VLAGKGRKREGLQLFFCVRYKEITLVKLSASFDGKRRAVSNAIFATKPPPLLLLPSPLSIGC
jgi:hypothetical protein